MSRASTMNESSSLLQQRFPTLWCWCQIQTSPHSIARQQQPQALSSHDDIADLSYPKAPSLPPKQLPTAKGVVTHKQDFNTVDPECNPLDTDDEAAQRILTFFDPKPSHTPFQSDDGGIRGHHPEPVQSTHSDHDPMDRRYGSSEDIPKNSGERNFMSASSHETKINPGRKRTLAESETLISPGKLGDDIEPLAKRQKGSSPDEMVVEKVEHDAAAWKEPSFARSRAKATSKERATQVGKDGAASSHQSSRLRASTHRQTDATRLEGLPFPGSSRFDLSGSSEAGNLRYESRPARLKLGGWQPRKDIPNGPGIMTWERFNTMLLKCRSSP
ncbi:hypothetical protein JB92DRAFT_1689796 [Gautieria morchelliformis]|nr:hypothetical protein JB92DRAFT_1689796 [Gautieria morchelliformis]